MINNHSEEKLGKILKKGFKISKDINNNSNRTKKKSSFSNQQSKYHIHIGAGNLGIGLVVRKFLSKKLIIIQRPSENWEDLEDSTHLKLSLNESCYLELPFLHQSQINFPIKINSFLEKGESFFVCTDNQPVLDKLFCNASSISTSLGNEGLYQIKSYLEKIKIANSQINIYPFENDYSIVNTINNDCLNVIPVIADKICFGRQIIDDELRVNAENFETVYILANNSQVTKEISTDNVIIVDDSDKYHFFRTRKLYLVNGLHMVAALFGYGYMSERKVPMKDWSSRYLTEVMGNPKIVEDLKTFIMIQTIRIILSSNKEALKQIYSTNSFDVIYGELYTYGVNILNKRFDFSLDHLGRLLNINLHNLPKLDGKLHERIGLAIAFINDKKTEINSLLPQIKSISISREDLLDSALKLQSNISNLWKEISNHLIQS